LARGVTFLVLQWKKKRRTDMGRRLCSEGDPRGK